MDESVNDMLSGLLEGEEDGANGPLWAEEDLGAQDCSSPSLPSNRRKYSSEKPLGSSATQPPKRVCPLTSPGKILLRFAPRDDATRAAMDSAGHKARYEMVVPVILMYN